MTRSFTRTNRPQSTLGIRRLLIAAAVAVFSATTVMTWFSPAEAVPRAVKRACKYDWKRLCPRYKRGPKLHACMRASVGGITPRCYNKLLEYGYGGRRAKKSRRRRRR